MGRGGFWGYIYTIVILRYYGTPTIVEVILKAPTLPNESYTLPNMN